MIFRLNVMHYFSREGSSRFCLDYTFGNFVINFRVSETKSGHMMLTRLDSNPGWWDIPPHPLGLLPVRHHPCGYVMHYSWWIIQHSYWIILNIVLNIVLFSLNAILFTMNKTWTFSLSNLVLFRLNRTHGALSTVLTFAIKFEFAAKLFSIYINAHMHTSYVYCVCQTEHIHRFTHWHIRTNVYMHTSYINRV